MDFDETPRFWYPRVALVRGSILPSAPTKTYDMIYVDLREKQRKKIIIKKKFLSLSQFSRPLISLSFILFDFSFLVFLIVFLILIIIIIIWINGSYYLIRVRFFPETIYFFSVQFILNELSSSHFLISEIFVKISSLKSLTTYHPENRKKISIILEFNENF